MRLLPQRRRLQISTRTLLLATLGICVWMGIWAGRARQQEKIVRQLYGAVGYRHEYDVAGKPIPKPIPPGPGWLRILLGNHAFYQVYRISSGHLNDQDLELVGQLRTLEDLDLNGPLSDEGLAKLAGLSRLKKLSLASPYITDAGLAYLQGMHDLQSFKMNCASVSDAGLKQLVPLKKLTTIAFEKSYITMTGEDWLKSQWPKATIDGSFPAQESEREIIQRLEQSGAIFSIDRRGWVDSVLLAGPRMTDETLAIVALLQNLKNLELNNTNISVAAVKRLREAHPNLQIRPETFQNKTESEEALAVLRRVNARVNFAANGYASVLVLSDKQLNDDDLKQIGKLSRLDRLWFPVVCKQITEDGWAQIGHCSSLKNLTFGDNQISNAVLEQLTGLVNLEYLTVGGRAITDGGLIHLIQLKQLKSLGLHNTSITGPGLKKLSELPKLSSLTMGGENSAMGDEGLQHFAVLPQLRTVVLTNLQITDAGLRHLSALPNLESVQLNDTRVTDAGLVHLQNLKKLKKLVLTNTDVSDVGVQALQQALPECKFTR